MKLLLNSVISTEGAKFMTLDIANFYLCTPLPRKEYLKMKLADFLDAVIARYDLKAKATSDGYVFVAIKSGMFSGYFFAGIHLAVFAEVVTNGVRRNKVAIC